MSAKRLITISKFLSKVLRHQPERAGLTLEPGGWVDIDALLAGCAKQGFPISREELETVVRDNDKQRFSFDETRLKIRANQGHSTEVDLALEPVVPPDILYHGTAEHLLSPVFQDGLLKMARHHVHLTEAVETAHKVGGRHGKAAVLEVDAAAMYRDGFVFFRSANGVWLTVHVPPVYLKRL